MICDLRVVREETFHLTTTFDPLIIFKGLGGKVPRSSDLVAPLIQGHNGLFTAQRSLTCILLTFSIFTVQA